MGTIYTQSNSGFMGNSYFEKNADFFPLCMKCPMPCFLDKQKAAFAQGRPLLIFTTGLRLGPGLSLFALLRFLNASSFMGILSDFGFFVHVKLAIPPARRILAFCDFGPIDLSRLKFAF